MITALRGDLSSNGVTNRERANPLGEKSATPWLSTVEPVSFGEIYAALVVLSGSDIDPSVASRIDLTVDKDRVDVTWPDGESTSLTLGRP